MSQPPLLESVFAKDVVSRPANPLRLGPRYIADTQINEVRWLGMSVARGRAAVQRSCRALRAHAQGVVPLCSLLPERDQGAADHQRVRRPMQRRVAHRATRPSDAELGPGRDAGGRVA
jgi:hypothetical protein